MGWFFFSSTLLALAACGGEPAPEKREEASAQVETHQRTWSEAGCETLDACTKVELEWIEVKGGPEVARNAINAWVQAQLLREAIGEEPSPDTESLAQDFLAEYAGFKSDYPDAAGSWLLERHIKELEAPTGILSLSADEYIFTGGAHGVMTESLASFDKNTGDRIGLQQIFKPGFEEPLVAAAEEAFRAARGISPDQSLTGAGYFMEGEFKISQNYALLRDGLKFHFDPYEIAPYAAGAIDFIVPWTEVSDLLRPDLSYPLLPIRS